MKKMMIFIMTLALTIGIMSCGSDKAGGSSKKGAKNPASCTLDIVVSYGGHGEDGTDLGSGTYDLTFNIKEGDAFYETYDGQWSIDSEADKYPNILTVESIGEDGVVVIIKEERVNIEYGSGYYMPSLFTVCDGINYSYVLTFSGYTK